MRTAKDAMRENLAIARGEIKELRERLEELERCAARDPRDWGFPGTVAHVAEVLGELNASLPPGPTEDLRRALASGRATPSQVDEAVRLGLIDTEVAR